MHHYLCVNNPKHHSGKAIPIVLVLIFVGLALSLSACTAVNALPTVIATGTPSPVPTLSPTPSPSATRSSTPSPTIKPSETQWPELIMPILPTNTPPVPTPASGRKYRLTDWTPEKAERMIDFLKNHPYDESNRVYGPLYTGYFFTGLAEMENALRFPEYQPAIAWRYNGAYDLYKAGNSDIVGLFAVLLANVLNQHEAGLDSLQVWLANTFSFSLEMVEVSPPPGYQHSVVLYVHEVSRSNGFAVWLVEKDGRYIGYPLSKNLDSIYSDSDTQVEVVDITGDGIAEAIVRYADWQSFGVHDGSLAIYRLDQWPPKEISFDPPFPNADISAWTWDGNTLIFETPIDTHSGWPCPMKVGWQYRWHQGRLELIQLALPMDELMDPESICARILSLDLNEIEFLQNDLILDTYKYLLDIPVPNGDYDLGESFYQVNYDRLKLALYMEDLGDIEGANEQIEKIRADEDPTSANWRNAAAEFFSIHQDPKESFEFCLRTQICETFLRRSEIISLIPGDRLAEAGYILQQMGIPVKKSGSYDFDQDGWYEKWLFILSEYPCGSGTGFWILSMEEDMVIGRREGSVCLEPKAKDVKSVAIRPLGKANGYNIYQIDVDGLYGLHRPIIYLPVSQENQAIDDYESWKILDGIQNNLLTKKISPTQALTQLRALQRAPMVPIKMGGPMPRLLYILGLAQELNGENQQAAQTYLELWRTYPSSPFAWMAYAKLEVVQ